MNSWFFSNLTACFTTALLLAVVTAVFACNSAPESREVPPPASPAPTSTPRPLEFPTDHSSHAAETEWWYYSGHLESDAGSDFGFHLALFRTGAENADRTFERIQASVVDLETGQHWHWVQDGIGDPANSEPNAGIALEATVGEAGVRIGTDGRHALYASGNPDGVEFELDLVESGGTMLHNSIGWLAFPLGASYYYTFPRMSASGHVDLPSRGRLAVKGEVWYDHQWGDFVVLGWPSGWYWVGLNLNDGASLMISEVRDVDGGRFKLFGTYLGPNGKQRTLDSDEDGIAIKHSDHWTSPETGAEYPIASRITVSSLGMDFELSPAIKEQETVAEVNGNAVASYWEGSVTATDSATGDILGRGYLELAGYAKPAPLSWRSADAE